jgi:hypothetical protein
MIKNLWDKDRKTIFRQLLKEYIQDGYPKKEAKKFASEEVSEIMSEKMSFIDNLQTDQWGDE